MLSTKHSILCVLEILTKYTNEEHRLNASEISKLVLRDYELNIERRSVYRNISYLQEFGYEISGYEENKGYYLKERKFEPSEISLLVDAVASSKFIPTKETNQLIDKLLTLESVYDQKLVKDIGVYKASTKTLNKDVFYNIELIQKAIKEKKKLLFNYCTYGFNKKLVPRREEKYIINPYAICCANEFYYLICNNDKYDNVSNYRIDFIKDIEILDEKQKVLDSKFDIENYIQNSVYMFSSEERQVVLICDNIILKDVIDKFGDNAKLKELPDNQFKAYINTNIRGMEFWVMQYINYCEVLEPIELREKIILTLEKSLKKYQ